MNKRSFIPIMIIPLFILISGGYISQTAGEAPKGKDVRRSVLAGTWYPGSRDVLTKVIDGYLSKAKVKPPGGELKAVIVPHAGYRYSGQVAAYAYQLIKSTDFKRVIMIGPSHRLGFRGVSVNLQSGYETPLGIVPVDQALARKIINTSPQIVWVPQAHAREHSLEIQLPFLQTVLRDFRIISILMGEQGLETCSHLATSLIGVMRNMEKTLLLASTDLSHFHNYRRARELDMEFIKYVRGLDPEGLARSLSSGACEACGRGPTITTMLAAQELGANRAVILKYANSGDVTGDRSRVVGYLSATLIKGN